MQQRIIELEERHREIDDLLKAERRFQSTLSDLPITAFHLDRELNLTWVNNSGQGLDVAELLRAPIADSAGDDQATLLLAAQRRVLESGVPERHEIAFPAGSRSHWFELRIEALRDESNAILGLSCVSIEITERKWAQEAIEQLGYELSVWKRIAEVFLTAPDEEMYGGVLKVILDTLHSPTGMFGYLDEQESLIAATQIPTPENEDLDSEDRAVLAKELWGKQRWAGAIREGRATFSNEPQQSTPQEQFVFERYVSMPINHQGRAIGLVLVANRDTDYGGDDIAMLESIGRAVAPILDARLQRDQQERQRRAIEAELRESENVYRSLVETSTDSVMLVDLEGTIRKANRRTVELFRFTDERELTGRPATFLPVPNEAGRLRQALETALADEHATGVECVFRRTDDTGFRGEVDASVVVDAAGEPKSIVVVVRDITERKRAEEEGVRVQKLESLGLLAGGVAHDFNNLLTGVITNLSIAQQESHAGEDVGESISEATDAARRARALTRQLLAFAKGSAPVKKAASVGSLVESTAKFALTGSDCRARFAIPEDLWNAEIDADQISQVVENLVINANQSMPTGGTIEIAARNLTADQLQSTSISSSPAGRYIEFTIRDEGIGIPGKILSNIFDPYFTTKQHGSGLGLAVVHAVIHRHGGKITVESVQGQGTTFRIVLPATEESGPEVRGVVTAPTRGEGRVLVMDDDPIVMRSTARLLTRLGYAVETAADGAETLQKYERAQKSDAGFDAVIMDLTVPGGMGGKEAIGKLLELDPEAKAIVSSGYSTDPVMSNYRRHGFKGVVVKPYELEEMAATLVNVIADEPAEPNADGNGLDLERGKTIK